MRIKKKTRNYGICSNIAGDFCESEWNIGASSVPPDKRINLKKTDPLKPLRMIRSLAASISITAMRQQYWVNMNIIIPFSAIRKNFFSSFFV
jgi:hypothetical protein